MGLYLCLVLLVVFCPLAIDIYLPAFPVMASEFATSNDTIALTISLFMAAVGLGQLLFGPLSDKYGRKPIAIIGIVLYLIGAIGVLFAPSIFLLLVARLIQGLGASATFVTTFALVRDNFSANKSAQMISYLNGIVCFIPALAPVIGAFLTLKFGWQANFILLAAFAIVGLILVSILIPARTLPSTGEQTGSFKAILMHPQFAFNGLICLFSMSSILAFVSKAPAFLMLELTLSTTEFTLWFSINAVISIVASFLAPQVIKRSTQVALIIGLTLMVLAGCALIWVASSISLLAFMLPIFVASFGFALTLGAAAGAALAPFKHMAGTASALVGLLQMSGAGVFVSILTLFELSAPYLIALNLLMSLPFLLILLSSKAPHFHPATSA